ncbi:ribonuclease R [Qiania dongpingensis]|uniref:Ribonuclease R n=1 Tax=Qiania dongpingensis TaxID=2763669 RepID=A0A7G9G805_9FIRM|nr:ribonuclease R [Qiania dongpingensis]
MKAEESFSDDRPAAERMEERKERLLKLFGHKNYVPLKIKELAILLGISKEERPELQEVLDALLSEGKIGLSKRGKYALAENFLITGTFLGNRKGFGFVVVEKAEGEEPEPDIFISEDEVGNAMDGDTVQVALCSGKKSGRRKNPEGRVVKVLVRAHEEIIATYEKCKNFGFAVPVNQKLCSDVFIPEEHSMEASTGERVAVKITDYGNGRKNPEGRVTEILGRVGDPGVDILSIAKAYGFESEFPDEVLAEVKRIPASVLPEELEGRKDFRSLQTVTIDGEDAKDLDDAISISMEDGIYKLGVHIADVSHYVKEGSALDREALKRGTSVYLTDRVIPMLPKELSNGICSLNAGVDRLAFSCIMEIDGKGRVLGHEIMKSVICVDRRMTYTAVKGILEDRDEKLRREYEELVPMFRLMADLSSILRAKRKKRGSIDFDFPESKILLDEEGRPVEIKPYDRNVATMLIEDFMLLANETVAEDYYWQGQPFVYRTHENPDPDKIRELALLISNFGFHLRMGQEEVHPKELQKLLAGIQDSPEEALISRLTLRSMKRAKYQPECIGHFGLAAKYYCHFTSPIRRYPDLQIHRIMGECLSGKMTEKRKEHYAGILPEVCAGCSSMERKADDAEREAEKLKKCQYMAGHIGEVFDGVISGVTGWGMYVELPNTVEGMISLSALDGDYYQFDEAQYRLVGTATEQVYKLGQRIRVRVAAVDKVGGTIDFVPERSWEEE